MALNALNPFAKTRTTRTRWLPEVNDGLRPQFARLANGLRLVERARAEGVETRPHTAERDLDEPQQHVVAEMQSGANLLKQFLSNQLHDAGQKIQARMPRPLDVELTMAEVHASVSEAKLAQREELEARRLQERRRLRDLRKFRQDHGLKREASYADEWWMPAALLVALTVGEGLANAALFAEGVDTGLIGGLALAMLFGLVNVLLGFVVTGFAGLRLLNRVERGFRALGALLTVAGIGAGAAWNLMVARYREAVERDPSATVVGQLLPAKPEEWIAFSSLESWALLLLGCVIFLIAALKGRGGRASFTDPYPGYRAVDLAHREAESVYVVGQETYKAAVRSVYDQARGTLRDRYAADERAVAEIAQIADQAEERAAEVRDSIGEWRDMGVTLLRRYREENVAIRTTAPPAYFDVYPSFAELSSGLADATALRALHAAAQRTHEANAKRLVEVEATLARSRQEETETFLSEIEAIEARADRRLTAEHEPDVGAPAAPRLAIPHATTSDRRAA
jgi:hypothetical protein